MQTSLEAGGVTEYQLTQPQSNFFLGAAKYPLFVGGFGSGKSTTQSFCALRDLMDYPGAHIGMYAPTHDLLNLITVPFIESRLNEAGLSYTLNKQNLIFRIKGHGSVICRSMANPGRIVGYEVFRSHVDEIDTIRTDLAELAWNKIIARNRQKILIDGVEQKNRVSAYTTPEGFGFAYKRWVKGASDKYVMYKAPTKSNPHLPEDYIESLYESYPEQLIEAYLNGDFVNLTSGSVYPGFDRRLNDSKETVEGNETIEVGMDFNVMKGAAGIHVRREGNPVMVDETYNAYDTDEQITVLRARYPRNPIVVYPDASGRNRNSANTTETDLQKLHNAGFIVVVDHSNPAIKDRVFSFAAMINNAKEERKWKINVEKCPHAVDSLEQQVWNENGLPDKSQDLDHLPDAIGYYIHNQFPIVKPTAGYSLGGMH